MVLKFKNVTLHPEVEFMADWHFESDEANRRVICVITSDTFTNPKEKRKSAILKHLEVKVEAFKNL